MPERGTRPVLRIGNVSGFFGDRLSAASELLDLTHVDTLTGDWLAELTMSILRKQQQRDPLKGYASTFLRQLEQVLGTCLERGTRIVSNAGGMNPAGCAEAVEHLAARLGLTVRVGHLVGDDITVAVPDLVASGRLTGLGAGDAPLAANAYLGGWAIADCLERDADVVVTGRVTDAALVIGPAAHAFGWARDDWDALAGALVAGHVIECGAQASGGNYSFYDEVPALDRVGFPVAEVHPDGSSVITLPEGAGGRVDLGTVTSQLLYEIQSERYLNPDVTALLPTVRLTQEAPDRVRIDGVRGEAPPETLKVSCVLPGGYRNAMYLALTGDDAPAKAAVAEKAVFTQVPGGRQAFAETAVDLIGRPAPEAEHQAQATSLLRIAVQGKDEALVGRGFADAVIATGLASYPGFYVTTPPGPAARYDRYVPAAVDKAAVTAYAVVNDQAVAVPHTPGTAVLAALPTPVDDYPAPDPKISRVRVRLGRLVGARSGDKGGDANLGLFVRDPAAYPWLRQEISVERLRLLVPETTALVIERHELPNLCAVNFVIRGFLGEGVSSCLKLDAQAKGLAEFVRSRLVDVPAEFVDRVAQR